MNTIEIKKSIEKLKDETDDEMGRAFNRGLEVAIKIIEIYENVYWEGLELQFKEDGHGQK